MEEIQALVDQHAQEGYFNHIERECTEALKSGSGDVVVKFWKAYAVSEQGMHTEAIRQLEPLSNSGEVALAATACLINTYKASDNKDKEELNKLKDQLKTLSKNADDPTLVFASRYFWHSGKAKQAKQCLEKVLGKNKKHPEALCLFGWLNLTSGNARNEKKSVTLFEQSLKLSKQNISALLGRARYNEKRQAWDKSLSDLNQVIVHHPNYLPGLIHKARVLMVMGNWEEALETANRVLKRDSDAIGALRLIVLYLLARETDSAEVSSRIYELKDAIDKYEPKNSDLYFEVAQLCSRLSARNGNTLQQAQALIEQAVQIDPLNSAYVTEQGYQLLLLEEYEAASKCFHEASKLDEGNLNALSGKIKCKVLMGKIEEASQELEFLNELSSDGSSPELPYMQALVTRQIGTKNEKKCMMLLQKAIDEHAKTVENVDAGYPYFIAYNPDFVLELVEEVLEHMDSEPSPSNAPRNPMLTKCCQILGEMLAIVPGLLGAHHALATANYVKGDLDGAERSLEACMKLSDKYAPAFILQAKINLSREQYPECSSALQEAYSRDFSITSTPQYIHIKANVLAAEGKNEEAMELLKKAMDMPGVKTFSPQHRFNVQDRLQIFMDLANLYNKLNNSADANKVIQAAKGEFSNTNAGAKIVLAETDFLIQRKDYKAAVSQLRSVPKESPNFIRSRMMLADIFLKYRKDKKQYGSCFMEIANTLNSAHGFVLLAEAYIRVQEPDKAINAYEKARSLDPDDSTLASKIGRALVTTHDYERAVGYYEDAAKGDPNKMYLYHELAELYIQMKNFDEAVRVLNEASSLLKTGDDEEVEIGDRINSVRNHGLLADVYQGVGNTSKMKECLEQGLQEQEVVLSGMRNNNPDAKREQVLVAANLCYRIAGLHMKAKFMEQAVHTYNEALKYDETHEKSRLALARIYLINNDLTNCQNQCVLLLRHDPNNREASMTLADIMFRKNQHENASHHFQVLLEKNPNNYDALSKLVQLMRRAGKLTEVPKYLKQAETRAQGKSAAGHKYAKGLYAWYNCDPKQALEQFNFARRNGEWGQKAIANMIEIYLDPDSSSLFSEANQAKGRDNADVISACEELLQELLAMIGKPNDKYIILDAYVSMATKSKSKVEEALNNLLELAQEDKDNVSVLLALANAFTLQNQLPKARNQLKRISKMRMVPEYAEDFEKSWLMLADAYVSSGKFDLAQDLCSKCLENNKSCAKAWEMLGVVMEKESAYQNAAENYENAWKYMNESSASIGFKLAFNYLKAKRYVEAIDVCHKVLTKFPNYPKIKKDIMDKARSSLRP